MSDEHFTRAPPIECRLISASMEIDDDDEDVIQVTIEVSNEAAMPIGGLDIFIQTSDNKKVESVEGISSLGLIDVSSLLNSHCKRQLDIHAKVSNCRC